jgi:hypothetical protein
MTGFAGWSGHSRLPPVSDGFVMARSPPPRISLPRRTAFCATNMRHSCFGARTLAFRLFIAGVLSGLTLTASAVAADSVPDFTGPWGRNTFNFESPDSGAGPIANLRRVGADAARSLAGGDPVPLVGDYNDPILKPGAAAVVKKNGEYSISGHDFPNPSNQCGADAPPFLFTSQQGMELLQGKNEIVILYVQDQQVRHVRLNAQHPRPLTPTPMGDSVGHYEGDTLVVDTVGIKLEPYTVVDRYGTPQSDAMHMVERYQLIGAEEAQAALDKHAKITGITGPMQIDTKYDKALRIEVTIDDSKTYTAPWKGNLTYRRVIRPYSEGYCAENNVDMFHRGDYDDLPTAKTTDFQ